MVRFLRILIIILLSVMTSACAPLKPRLEPSVLRVVDERFQELDEGGRPGAAVLVSYRGDTVYEEYFGQAQLEYDAPITERTRFNAGSIAKQIVGYAVLRLAQSGELDLDAPMRKYLPDMPTFDKPITLRHLLHHTSGLRDGFNLLAMAGWQRDDVITDEHLRRVLRDQRTLNHLPGAEFSYTNSGYVLLAEIIETAIGTSLANWAQARVFDPLGMDNSFFVRSHETVIDDFAYSFEQVQGEWRHVRLNSSAAGAGGLITTARDLSRWLNYLMELRSNNDPVWAAMLAQGVLADGKVALNRQDESYGAGVFIGQHRGQFYVGHGGGVAGYRAAAYLFPEDELAVVVLMNAEWRSAQTIARELAERSLRELGVSLGERARSPEYQGKIDTELIREASGLYVAPQPDNASNLPSHVGIALVEESGLPKVAVLGDQAEVAQPLSPKEFHTSRYSRIHFRLEQGQQGPQLAADFGDGFVTLQPVTCSPTKAEREALAGRYWSAELKTVYYLAGDGERIDVSHPRYGSAWLLCLAPDVFIAAGMPTDTRWGFTKAAVKRGSSGAVEGLYLFNGERARKVLFDKH